MYRTALWKSRETSLRSEDVWSEIWKRDLPLPSSSATHSTATPVARTRERWCWLLLRTGALIGLHKQHCTDNKNWDVCVYVCKFACIMYIYMYVCTCLCVYIYVCMYVHVYVYIYIYICRYVCMCVCKFAYIMYVCMYMFMCVYIYMYVRMYLCM
jgi:nuclear pore complex protein Nup62